MAITEASKEFWSDYYATGGLQVKLRTMHCFSPDFFWKEDTFEQINSLDATDYIPTGGTRYGTHTIYREPQE